MSPNLKSLGHILPRIFSLIYFAAMLTKSNALIALSNFNLKALALLEFYAAITSALNVSKPLSLIDLL
jgi:hypothetical protein